MEVPLGAGRAMQGPGPEFSSVPPPRHSHRGPVCLGCGRLPSVASALPCPGCWGFEDMDGRKIKTQQRVTRRGAGRPVPEAGRAPWGAAPCDHPPTRTLQAQQQVSCEQPRCPEPLRGSRQGAMNGGRKRAPASASTSKRLGRQLWGWGGGRGAVTPAGA